MSDFIFNEPKEYDFKDRDGHSGKFFKTGDKKLDYLVVECEES